MPAYRGSTLIAVLLLIAVPIKGSADDTIVALTDDLGCWYFAAPPPPYGVFIRRSESAESERVHFDDSTTNVALGFGPRGEALVAREGGVYRFTTSGPSRIVDLPPGFRPSAIVSSREGTSYIFGDAAVAIWNGVGSVVVEPVGGSNFSIRGVDLAADGCTAIRTMSGSVYRANLCAAPRTWELWIPATGARAAFFAPNNEVVIELRRQVPASGPYISVIEVRDANSLALKRELPLSRHRTLIGLGSDGRSFWMMPLNCEVDDLALQKHSLLSGSLLAEVSLYYGEVDDKPTDGMVEYGWRAAVGSPAPADVPSLSSPLLIALCGMLLAVGCWAIGRS